MRSKRQTVFHKRRSKAIISNSKKSLWSKQAKSMKDKKDYISSMSDSQIIDEYNLIQNRQSSFNATFRILIKAEYHERKNKQ